MILQQQVPSGASTILSIWVGPLISVVLAYVVAIATKHEKEIKRERQLAQIQFMVRQLWVRVFKTGVIEGLANGFMETNSPLRTTIEAFHEHEDFLKKLREFYEREGRYLSDLDLLVMIDQRFDKDLTSIQLKHKLIGGAALAAACFLVRPDMSLFDHQPIEEWETREKQ